MHCQYSHGFSPVVSLSSVSVQVMTKAVPAACFAVALCVQPVCRNLQPDQHRVSSVNSLSYLQAFEHRNVFVMLKMTAKQFVLLKALTKSEWTFK